MTTPFPKDALAAQLESANKSRDALSVALASEKGRREEASTEVERWRQEAEKWRLEVEETKKSLKQAVKVRTFIRAYRYSCHLGSATKRS